MKFQVLEKRLRRIKRMKLEKGDIHQGRVFGAGKGGRSGDEEQEEEGVG
ncbi:MAG TPA: hypothetical protein VK568_03925 [Thermodesulfobacteriota bacterium]|nr:hypothetical protein [Thermodesulfobacteriota bacterium]